MEGSVALNNKKVGTRYLIASIFMLLFIFSDLLFDFAFSFEASDIIAFGFTILSAIIVFYCNSKIRNDEYRNKYYTTSTFIKSNFNNSQVIFSILDIVCGLISILSSAFFLSYAFKVVRIFYIPAKVLVVANKNKSLLKPLAKFSFFWTSMRLLDKKGGNMINFIKSNKFTILFGVLISAFCGYASYIAIPALVALPLWANIVLPIAIAIGVFALVFFVGHDTVESLALRFAKKVLPEDRYNGLVNQYNDAVIEIEKAKEEEKAKANAEKEAKKLAKEEAKTAKKETKVKVDKKAEKLARKQLKADEKAKAKAEFDAKVQEALAKIKAEQNNQ